MQKFLQSDWATQGFEAKKRLKADWLLPRSQSADKSKKPRYSSYKTPFLDIALQLGLGF
nr:hypothetical protein [uncultured Campylobacter sp.]